MKEELQTKKSITLIYKGIEIVKYNSVSFRLFLLVLMVFIFAPQNSFAYDDQTTHPAITAEMVDSFNSFTADKISALHKSFVVKGSIDEDYPETTSLNHFFDPLQNIGFYGYRSSKDWATNKSLVINSFTWSKSVQYYAEGNLEMAFLGLGHILHLIEDLGVPDHTRNDPHPGVLWMNASPYENWAKIKNANTLHGLAGSYAKKDILFYGDLSQYFDYLALYSNNNFVSANTIDPVPGAFEYKKPEILRWDGSYTYGIDNLAGDQHPIYRKFINPDSRLMEKVIITDNDTSIVSDYFVRLSDQLMRVGPGVVDLFMKEGKAARENYLAEIKKKNEADLKTATALAENLSQKGYAGLVLSGIVFYISDAYQFALKAVTIPVTATVNGVVYGVGYSWQLGSSILGMTSYSAKTEASVTEKKVETLAKNTAQAVDATLTAAGRAFDRAAHTAFDAYGVSVVGSLASVVVPTESSPAVVVKQSTTLANAPLAVSTVSVPLSHQQSGMIPGFGGGGPGVSKNTDMAIVVSATTSMGENVSDLILVLDYPRIVTPSDFSVPFENTEIEFVGSAVSSSTVKNNFSTTTILAGIDGTWTQKISFPVGTTTIQFWAEKGSLLSGSTSVTLSVRDNSPVNVGSVVFDIPECLGSITPSSCLIASPRVSLFWQSENLTIKRYELYQNGQLVSIASSSVLIEALSAGSYEFDIKGFNSEGAVIATSSRHVSINPFPVVMSDVAWAGTTASSRDQWIELTNNTDETVSLDGWSIVSVLPGAESTHLDIPLRGIIAPHGRFLLEHGSDSTVSDVSADMIYGADDSGDETVLAQDGEKLGLFFGSMLMDETAFGVDGHYPAGGGESKFSMERYDVSVSGNTGSNWGNAIPYFNKGHSSDGAPIIGSPGAQNTVTHLINYGRDISGSVELVKDNNPYVILDKTLSVESGGRLVVGPGVIIKIKDAGISVSGIIELNGTADEPIIFSSLFNDSIDGDTDGDGGMIVPGDNRWYGFTLFPEASGSRFSHTHISFVAQPILILGSQNIRINSILVTNGIDSVACYSCELTMTNSSFRHMDGGNGLFIADNSSSTIDTVIFEGRGKQNEDDGPYGTALLVDGSRVAVNNVTISGFGWANSISASGMDGTISNVTIESDGSMWGLDIGRSSNITAHHIRVSGAFICAGINGGSDVTLTDSQFSGGETGVIGVSFGGNSRGNLSHIVADGFLSTGVSVRKSGVTITDSVIKNNRFGIEILPTVSYQYRIPVRKSFLAHLFDGIFSPKSAEALEWSDGTSYVNIRNSALYNNSVYSIKNYTDFAGTATGNWWGDATGPYHSETNLSGLGDEVANYVDYTAWLDHNPVE